ncbi:MAG: histidine phosphatase family protein [Deltaproteobacteria bacterium]|nr:histidine phosphatase family protein [Deltaproteobacteria bacterium]
MSEIVWQIPPSLRRQLATAPTRRPVVLLIRHSVRDELPPADAGYTLPITEVGRDLARELGAVLGTRLKTLHASPLIRCVQTAEAIGDGAGVALNTERDRLLGDPGVFVLDGRQALAHWQTLGHEGVMAQLVSGSAAMAAMARPDEAARFLVHHMLAVAGDVAGVHVFVTHDSLVTATAARLLGLPLGPDSFPWYLEAAAFWRVEDGVHTTYRDFTSVRRAPALCSLDAWDVVEFARREIAGTIGLDCDARFFLAGGAFKTLLTGRPPRDLDLWAASPADREALLLAIDRQGGRRLAPQAFADAFEMGGRTVEVPHKVSPSSLEERLARFDIALSAVGVEHRPGDNWVASIHPLARRSVEQRQVLLLKPLVNWKYALATLERMRRYAQELGYDVPAEEEAEVWRVFDSLSSNERRELTERLDQTGRGHFGLRRTQRRGSSD